MMKPEFTKSFTTLNELQEDADDALKRTRGLKFEKLINEIMIDEGISLTGGYHTADKRSEQIDGAIEINHRIFLLEVKWVASNLAASELFAFLGKIENKFNGTLGVFISRNQLTENFINALNRGRRQSVIVLHGDDIESIFASDFRFKDYITEAFRILSFNNISHYPVKKYLEDKKEKVPDAPAENSLKEVKDFINQFLLTGRLDRDSLMLELNLGKKEIYDPVYSYVVNTFWSVWSNGLKHPFNFDSADNFIIFLESYEPGQVTVKKEAEKYYSKLLPQYFDIYSREIFIQMFSKEYVNLPEDNRHRFEEFIMSKSKDVLNDWNKENALTDVVSPIWGNLTSQTKEILSDFYLDIYISTRADKFAQKAFSMVLVSSGKISRNTIKRWLDEKLERAKKSYDTISEESLRTIAITYFPAAKILYADIKDWYAYVKENMNT